MAHIAPLLGMGCGNLQVMALELGNVLTVNVRDNGQDVDQDGMASSKSRHHMTNMSFWGPDLGCRPPNNNHGRACPEPGQ